MNNSLKEQLLERIDNFYEHVEGADFRVAENEAAFLQVWCQQNGISMEELQIAKEEYKAKTIDNA